MNRTEKFCNTLGLLNTFS